MTQLVDRKVFCNCVTIPASSLVLPLILFQDQEEGVLSDLWDIVCVWGWGVRGLPCWTEVPQELSFSVGFLGTGVAARLSWFYYTQGKTEFSRKQHYLQIEPVIWKGGSDPTASGGMQAQAGSGTSVGKDCTSFADCLHTDVYKVSQLCQALSQALAGQDSIPATWAHNSVLSSGPPLRLRPKIPPSGPSSKVLLADLAQLTHRFLLSSHELSTYGVPRFLPQSQGSKDPCDHSAIQGWGLERWLAS